MVLTRPGFRTHSARYAGSLSNKRYIQREFPKVEKIRPIFSQQWEFAPGLLPQGPFACVADFFVLVGCWGNRTEEVPAHTPRRSDGSLFAIPPEGTAQNSIRVAEGFTGSDTFASNFSVSNPISLAQC